MDYVRMSVMLKNILQYLCQYYRKKMCLLNMNNSYNVICVYLRSKGSHWSSLSVHFLRALLLAIISVTHLYFFFPLYSCSSPCVLWPLPFHLMHCLLYFPLFCDACNARGRLGTRSWQPPWNPAPLQTLSSIPSLTSW